MRDLWTTVDGQRMYARCGNAAAAEGLLPVVLVHGFGISSSYFVPTVRSLAREFAVYAPDLPGHGKSATPPRALDISGLADALIAWMDAVGLSRAALVANSMGCQVAVDAAVRFPQRVDRLVLSGITCDPSARTFWKQLRRYFGGGGGRLDLSLVWLCVRDYSRMGLRLFAELRFMLRDRVEDKLPRLSMPVMLVRGERDKISPQPWFEQTARLVRAERTAVLRGGGHAVHYSDPEQFLAAIRDFLKAAATKCGEAARSSVPQSVGSA